MVDIFSIVWQSLSITLFVVSMMLVIEYLNVITQGIWGKNLQKSPAKQVLLGAVLGILPGCLGAYTAVSLYIHNLFSAGALVAAMIATSGDEAFFLFSIVPQTALIITAILFVVAVLAGFVVNLIAGRRQKTTEIKHLHIHKNEAGSVSFDLKRLGTQLRYASKLRLLLVVVLLMALVLILINFEDLLHGLGQHDHSTESHFHPRWVGITFAIVLSLSFFVVITVSDHFLEEHLLNHIIKKHLLRIFLWTFLTLLALYYLRLFIPLDELITDNLTLVLLFAVLIGIIPESGPHLLFIILFASGDIPFSILLANSIVQDGHGSLPLMAESPRGFLKVKLINILVGLAVGGVGLLFSV
jgi:hypothetical protein